MNDCPCCSHTLLQHIRSSGTYWFCRHCWQEMPVFSENRSVSLANLFSEQVSTNQETSHKNQISFPNVQQSSEKEWIGVEELSELLHATP